MYKYFKLSHQSQLMDFGGWWTIGYFGYLSSLKFHLKLSPPIKFLVKRKPKSFLQCHYNYFSCNCHYSKFRWEKKMKSPICKMYISPKCLIIRWKILSSEKPLIDLSSEASCIFMMPSRASGQVYRLRHFSSFWRRLEDTRRLSTKHFKNWR